MPRPPFHRLPTEKSTGVVDAAISEFARYGYERASLARIIAIADTSKGALYYWFDDKEDLFVTAASHALRPVATAIGKPGPVGSVDGYWHAVAGMISSSLAIM